MNDQINLTCLRRALGDINQCIFREGQKLADNVRGSNHINSTIERLELERCALESEIKQLESNLKGV